MARGRSAGKLNLDMGAMHRIIHDSPRLKAVLREKAALLCEYAIEDFERQQVHGNEYRTSETTPPKYVEEFEVEQDEESTRAVNHDPGGVWVEFGAHAGGRTAVLRYRPFGHAIDRLAAETD